MPDVLKIEGHEIHRPQIPFMEGLRGWWPKESSQTLVRLYPPTSWFHQESFSLQKAAEVDLKALPEDLRPLWGHLKLGCNTKAAADPAYINPSWAVRESLARLDLGEGIGSIVLSRELSGWVIKNFPDFLYGPRAAVAMDRAYTSLDAAQVAAQREAYIALANPMMCLYRSKPPRSRPFRLTNDVVVPVYGLSYLHMSLLRGSDGLSKYVVTDQYAGNGRSSPYSIRVGPTSLHMSSFPGQADSTLDSFVRFCGEVTSTCKTCLLAGLPYSANTPRCLPKRVRCSCVGLSGPATLVTPYDELVTDDYLAYADPWQLRLILAGGLLSCDACRREEREVLVEEDCPECRSKGQDPSPLGLHEIVCIIRRIKGCSHLSFEVFSHPTSSNSVYIEEWAEMTLSTPQAVIMQGQSIATVAQDYTDGLPPLLSELRRYFVTLGPLEQARLCKTEFPALILGGQDRR